MDNKKINITKIEQYKMRKVLGADLELSERVEESLQNAYSQIKTSSVNRSAADRKEVILLNRQNRRTFYKRGAAVAAVTLLLAGSSVGVMAATGFFQKDVVQQGDTLTYEFAIDYDLKPGEYKVEANYLPQGYTETEENKYSDLEAEKEGKTDACISILPVYNTEDLDRIGKNIEQTGVAQVEKKTLSGMEANVITSETIEGYAPFHRVFLFNSQEGYVIELYGGADCALEELEKVADNLIVTRTGDTDFETEEDKNARLADESRENQAEENRRKTMEQAIAAGIPEDELYGIGEEVPVWKLENGEGMDLGYTVTGYEYMDSIADFDPEGFYDYDSLTAWLNEDGTLKPHERLSLDQEGNLLSRDTVETQFLKVNVTAHRYNDNWGDTWQRACEN